MRIERLNKCCGSRGVLTAVDFQPHFTHNSIHRLATAGGTYIQIWAIGRNENDTHESHLKCVCLFKFTGHTPYEVSTVRWSPNGQYVASTDSGGITHVLVRNSKKSDVIESIINNKLSGEQVDISTEIIETKEVKKYTFKYDGTNSKNKATNPGSSAANPNNRITHSEAHDVIKDHYKLYSTDNLDGNLEYWDSLGAIHCPSNMGQLFDISWASDNRSIVGGGMNGQVAVFDIHTKEIVAKFDTSDNTIPSPVSGRGYIKSVAWDPMTLHIAVQCSNKEISVWRRSPPLPPNSHMKWKFKRVLFNSSLFEKTNSDVLGGSRISWSPNGKFVAFPNAGLDHHKFTACYEVHHNTATISSSIDHSKFDKYQIQYLYDTAEHHIDEDPLLLKGHTSRIRNVRFSPDIMKPVGRNIPGVNKNACYDKFVYFAQCSDDSMLSIWRFKLNTDTSKRSKNDVDCICVLQNILDEQSSVEDMSWGNNGQWLAVASSQGGLILIEFTLDELASRFSTNWISGMNLTDMSEPSILIFDYVDLVNSNIDNSDDGNKSDYKANGIKHLSRDNGAKYNSSIESHVSDLVTYRINKKLLLFDRNRKALYLAYIFTGYMIFVNFVISVVKTILGSILVPTVFSYLQKVICERLIKERSFLHDSDIDLVSPIKFRSTYFYRLIRELLIIECKFTKTPCLHSLLQSMHTKRSSSFKIFTSCNVYQLWNFVIVNEGKNDSITHDLSGESIIDSNSQLKDNKSISIKSAKSKKNTSDGFGVNLNELHPSDVWLDMDYSSSNTMLPYYWNNFDDKTANESVNDIICPTNPPSIDDFENSLSSSHVTRSSSETKQVTSDGTRTQIRQVRWFNMPSLEDSLTIVISQLNYKILGINFLENRFSPYLMSASVSCIEETNGCISKIHWIKHFSSGFITHMDFLNNVLIIITQWSTNIAKPSNVRTDLNIKYSNTLMDGYLVSPESDPEGDRKNTCHLTIINVITGNVYIDSYKLNLDPISKANLYNWGSNTYISLITTTGFISLYSFKGSDDEMLCDIMVHDLNSILPDTDNVIFKIELLNSSLNSYHNITNKFMCTNDRISKFVKPGGTSFYSFYLSHILGNVSPKTLEDLNGSAISTDKIKKCVLHDEICILVYLSNQTIFILTRNYLPLLVSRRESCVQRVSLPRHTLSLSNIFDIYTMIDNVEDRKDTNVGHTINSHNFNEHVKSNVILKSIVCNLSKKLGTGFVPHKISNSSLNLVHAHLKHCNANILHRDFDVKDLKHNLSICLILGSTWEYIYYLYLYIFSIFSRICVNDIVEITEYFYRSILNTGASLSSNDIGSSKELYCFEYEMVESIGLNCVFILRNIIVLMLYGLNHFVIDECKSRSIPFERVDGDVAYTRGNFSKCPNCFTEYCTIYEIGCPLANAKVLLKDSSFTDDAILNILKLLSKLIANIQIWEGAMANL